MSLTYTTQHYEWQQRVNKETMFAMRFNQCNPSRFNKSSSRMMKTLPYVQHLNSNYNLLGSQVHQSSSELKRPKTSVNLNLNQNSVEQNLNVHKFKAYIKELESKLRSEKLKRIKSETLLKNFTLSNRNAEKSNLTSILKSKLLKKSN